MAHFSGSGVRSSDYTASFIQDWDCDLDHDPVFLLRVNRVYAMHIIWKFCKQNCLLTSLRKPKYLQPLTQKILFFCEDFSFHDASWRQNYCNIATLTF